MPFTLSKRHYTHNFKKYTGESWYQSYDESLYQLFTEIICDEQDLNDSDDLIPLIEYPVNDIKEVIYQLQSISLRHDDKDMLLDMMATLSEDDMLYFSYE